MTETQRDAISSPAVGLLIFQTDVTPGYYYYIGLGWLSLISTGPGGVSISGLIDSDGNTYPTITIGNQVWMAENLKVKHYRNGDAIPNETDARIWQGLSTGAYCWYDNDQTTHEKYGALYNWYAVDDSRGLCPEGWHVPTHAEWITLTTYLGGEFVAGGKMKATSDLWTPSNQNAIKASNFSGLPGGFRTGSGPFVKLGSDGIFCSSSENFSNSARVRYLWYGNGYLEMDNHDKQYGISVRCLRDY